MQFFRLFSYVALILAASGSVLATGSDFVKTMTTLTPDQLKAVNEAYDTYGAQWRNVPPAKKSYILKTLKAEPDQIGSRYAELDIVNADFREIQTTGKRPTPSPAQGAPGKKPAGSVKAGTGKAPQKIVKKVAGRKVGNRVASAKFGKRWLD